MANPYLGEIRMFAGNFAPYQWALCNGQLLPIMQNEALYTLLGTIFGGDGVTTFGLPDLRSRAPVHAGQGSGLSNYVLGEKTGSEGVVLNASQMPIHSHPVNAVATGGTQAGPGGGFPAVESTGTSLNYGAGPANATMAQGMVGTVGGTTAVPVIQPVLAVTFIIALAGIFPSRS
jgi:microcystin-dependent protein